jgi:CHASE2 domain-containing sensor protein
MTKDECNARERRFAILMIFCTAVFIALKFEGLLADWSWIEVFTPMAALVVVLIVNQISDSSNG